MLQLVGTFERVFTGIGADLRNVCRPWWCREMRSLLRRYPDFTDMRAALAGALWSIGKEGDAENNW